MPGRARVRPVERATRKTVAILGGDPVVGRTLELLLRDAYHDVRYANTNSPEPPVIPGDVRVVLLGPGWDTRSRDAALLLAADAPGGPDTPVLELGFPADEARPRQECYIPWPCRSEELKKDLRRPEGQ